MQHPDEFWLFVNMSGECWEWMGGKNRGGYGQCNWRGRTERAHRVAWMIENGAIPQGQGFHGSVVMHSCDNRLCCNPAHLSVASHEANMADMAAKGRRKGIGTGRENGRAVLTEADVAAIRSDARGKIKLSREYGVSPAQIQRIRAGKAWAAL